MHFVCHCGTVAWLPDESFASCHYAGWLDCKGWLKIRRNQTDDGWLVIHFADLFVRDDAGVELPIEIVKGEVASEAILSVSDEETATYCLDASDGNGWMHWPAVRLWMDRVHEYESWKREAPPAARYTPPARIDLELTDPVVLDEPWLWEAVGYNKPEFYGG